MGRDSWSHWRGAVLTSGGSQCASAHRVLGLRRHGSRSERPALGRGLLREGVCGLQGAPNVHLHTGFLACGRRLPKGLETGRARGGDERTAGPGLSRFFPQMAHQYHQTTRRAKPPGRGWGKVGRAACRTTARMANNAITANKAWDTRGKKKGPGHDLKLPKT